MDIRSVVHFGAVPSRKRQRSMHPLKQGLAAIMLVLSLGSVVPSVFGGSAAADPTPGQGTADGSPRWLHCDLNGDGTFTDASYYVISQSDSSKPGFHDLNSSTVLIYQSDQRFTRYYPVDPSVDNRPYVDIPGRSRGPKIGGNANGLVGKVVACQEDLQHIGDLTACADAATASDCPPLMAGVRYDAWAGRTWYVTFSAGGQGAGNAASVRTRSQGKHRH